ncbi:UDP-glucose/GDP-mannose dehydrogenase family protein [Paenalcaligenes niemegkensis]|uniref:UDP-glucose dehydrogenase family protein n=1 Tax=Paenalcaligenes niemegkensis TaxID=2895469 RepID=UPI001EE94081|nr:UDP-glucose/GDP-mannose dehydrogenase family protein [Paenalcaligenes niemegkensis]MCQ9617210.1 UDP-glucose/GDP-mannose dehydrogenase family protein [Paenalcaligenes niemegkensis]
MNVVVIGSGYVGLVTGCCLAEAGNTVVCVDHDAQKVAALSAYRVPFHEPQLAGILEAQLKTGRLTFERSIKEAMTKADVVFLAVGTPSNTDGSANLDNLLGCANELAKTICGDCIIVIKSTVPVGTGDRIEQIFNKSGHLRAAQFKIGVVSNPEFLAEGRAVQDFRHPDRIVIGSNDSYSFSILARLYAPFDSDGLRLVLMDRRSAEFAKYACNSMLAARISMINELSILAGALGADISSICQVLKGDPRIGGSYLHPGIGYGGSCLPKDLSALIDLAQNVGEPAYMLRSIQMVNTCQKQRLLQAVRNHFNGHLSAKNIAIWGLSFKPDTDDVRAAPSLSLIRSLLDEGAVVKAYDPVAQSSAQVELGRLEVEFGESALAVCEEADALVVMTEWEEFKAPDWNALAQTMRGKIVFDARALYTTATLQQYGLQHYRLGQIKLPKGRIDDGLSSVGEVSEVSAKTEKMQRCNRDKQFAFPGLFIGINDVAAAILV